MMDSAPTEDGKTDFTYLTILRTEITAFAWLNVVGTHFFFLPANCFEWSQLSQLGSSGGQVFAVLLCPWQDVKEA